MQRLLTERCAERQYRSSLAQRFQRPDVTLTLDAIAHELANLRAALDWLQQEQARHARATRLAAGLCPALIPLSHVSECARRARCALAVMPDDLRGSQFEVMLQAALGQSLMYTMGDGAEDLHEADGQGAANFGQMVEIVPRISDPYPPLDTALAAEIVGAFPRMPAGARSRVQLALHRLGQALRRHALGDKAIELAIALETLNADGGNNEVSHKVKVRATKILGGDGPTRTRNAKLIAET